MGAKHVVGAAVAAWVAVGCGVSQPQVESTPSMDTAVAKLASPNGRNMNGRNMNGSFLNRMLVAVRYDGAKREGMSTPMDSVWLEGSVLHGLSDTEELSGLDFLKVRFTGELDNGQTVALRVDSATQGQGADQDIWSYGVSYQDPADGYWYPICTNADGSPAKAIALENRWDYRQGVEGGGSKIYDASAFTFACEGAALAKCVRFGYAPWRSLGGTSLEGHHQACTRMVRADFCGDGTSYTVDGNWVNLYDSMNVQVDSESWVAEAEWTSNGASCVTSKTRATSPIQCGSGMVVNDCGTNFSSGALLISETPPAQP
ncbi:ADYC domain-containing protein [Hyalangium rubrum]|uniref:ADYC domain-containing protein n=1 Tax=Hyalangium rubrum TaxID=3103134 RepID=A0ABU5GXS3_9BACT|nr:ADYC domain-containing protein [Hyalangium sp. s54d21]MDY7225992.1 ADYC domain-containing protein [Hyalangium sp. s54d21]